MRILIFAVLLILVLPLVYAETAFNHTLEVTLKMPTADTSQLHIDNAESIVNTGLVPRRMYPVDTRYFFEYANVRIGGILLASGALSSISTDTSLGFYHIIYSVFEDARTYLLFTKGDVEHLRERLEKHTSQSEWVTHFGLGEEKKKVSFIGLEAPQNIHLRGNETLLPGTYQIIVRAVNTTDTQQILEVVRK